MKQTREKEWSEVKFCYPWTLRLHCMKGSPCIAQFRFETVNFVNFKTCKASRRVFVGFSNNCIKKYGCEQVNAANCVSRNMRMKIAV